MRRSALLRYIVYNRTIPLSLSSSLAAFSCLYSFSTTISLCTLLTVVYECEADLLTPLGPEGLTLAILLVVAAA